MVLIEWPRLVLVRAEHVHAAVAKWRHVGGVGPAAKTLGTGRVDHKVIGLLMAMKPFWEIDR